MRRAVNGRAWHCALTKVAGILVKVLVIVLLEYGS